MSDENLDVKTLAEPGWVTLYLKRGSTDFCIDLDIAEINNLIEELTKVKQEAIQREQLQDQKEIPD